MMLTQVIDMKVFSRLVCLGAGDGVVNAFVELEPLASFALSSVSHPSLAPHIRDRNPLISRARSADDDEMEMGYDDEHDDDPSARRRDVTTRRPAPAAGADADADLDGAGKRPTKAHRASKRSSSGTLDTRTAGSRGGGLGGDLDASGAAGATLVQEVAKGCASVRDDDEGEEEEEVRDGSEEMLGAAVCEAGGAGAEETGGAVRKREGGADNTVPSISAPRVELDREKDEELEEEGVEEDSEEEGAVDDNVDDLTFFDDATQPDGTDPEWDRY